MTKPSLSIFLFCLMWISWTAQSQSVDGSASDQTLVASFYGGYSRVFPGSRYRSVDSGYQVELAAHYALSHNIFLGGGFLWGASSSVDAPEFDVFAPLDHSIWMEYRNLYINIRYRPFYRAENLRPFSPYIFGRTGWANEFAEYSGPRITRSGPFLSGGFGISTSFSRHMALDISAIMMMARYGDATVFEGAVGGSASVATGLAIRAGLNIGM